MGNVPKRLCFLRKMRLDSRKDFDSAFKSPVKVFTSSAIFFAHCNGQSHARLGITVAKRILRLSVQRNMVKRQLRESFRQYQHHLVGWDVVVLIRNGITPFSKQLFREQIEKQWVALGKKCEQPFCG